MILIYTELKDKNVYNVLFIYNPKGNFFHKLNWIGVCRDGTFLFFFCLCRFLFLYLQVRRNNKLMARKLTFKEIEDKGLLIYKYIRGSHAYGLNLPTSDMDEGGVYIEPIESLLGLGYDYQDQINDETNDTTWYSLRKFLNLLMNGNPNILEALFVDNKFVLYEHPIMTEIKKHRHMFLTKNCFNSFIGYSKSQIKKARGLNKKIVNPVTEKKDVLDFCYTFKEQGSQSMKEFLKKRAFDQKYCGLVNIPNMKDTYGVYYDYAAWLHFALNKQEPYMVYEYTKVLGGDNWENVYKRIENKEFFGYSGIVHPDGKSNEVRLSSIPKGEKPICFMTYNKDGYESHCKKYTEYQDWVEKRNPERYNENKEKDYDRKNVAHCVRLIHMGIELAKTGQFNVDRTNIDREFLLSIRQGNRTYDEVMAYVEDITKEMENEMMNSKLPDNVDKDFINDMLLNIRKEQLKEYKEKNDL